MPTFLLAETVAASITGNQPRVVNDGGFPPNFQRSLSYIQDWLVTLRSWAMKPSSRRRSTAGTTLIVNRVRRMTTDE